MKQYAKVQHPMGRQTTATIIINEDGLSVVDKIGCYCSDDGIIKNHLKKLIDLDECKHSWHLSIDKAQHECSPENKKVREILREKIMQREKELQMLKNGIEILNRWQVED